MLDRILAFDHSVQRLDGCVFRKKVLPKFINVSFMSSDSKSYGLSDYLKQCIKISGPLTVAKYMEEALINPKWGYYMHQDVFGARGDFTTSPEVGQVFGELIGIWYLSQWIAYGKPTNLQLVEFGPGRGTLMADILRVFSQFKGISECVTVNMIEVSPHLKQLQKQTLCGRHASEQEILTDKYKTYVSKGGCQVNWCLSIDEVKPGPCFVLAHELFDALPVHLFKKTEKGWRELLVDNSQDGFHLVTAPGPSPLFSSFPSPSNDHIEYEVSPSSFNLLSNICKHVNHHGGCGLIVDYGEDGNNRHSLRAFKNHQLHDVFDSPGTADITANVDFSLLRKACQQAGGSSFGPITQRHFLHQMGIQQRLEVLLKNANRSQVEDLKSSYHYLTDETSMGETFKFFAFGKKHMECPVAFRPV